MAMDTPAPEPGHTPNQQPEEPPDQQPGEPHVHKSEEANTRTTMSAQKRARTYSRRHKKKTHEFDIGMVFAGIREQVDVKSIVMSDDEYLQELWQIYRSSFHGQYSFPLFEERMKCDSNCSKV
jgi:hypothetical protein